MATSVQSLANEMPVRNAQAATGIRQANDLGIQALSGQAVAKAPAVANVKQASQQLGAAQAVTTGQAQVSQAQQQVQKAGQVGQIAIQDQQNTAKNQLATKKLGLDKESLTNQAKLANISEDLKSKLFDAQMSFKKDEMGRTWMNERQLADWAKTKAKSAEDLEKYKQQATQTWQRKEMVLKTAHAKVLQAIQQETQKGVQSYNQEVLKRMQEAKLSLEGSLRDLDANKAMASAKWGMIGTVGGAVAGAFIGSYSGNTATGAMMGGSAGGAAGSGLGPSIEGA